MQNVIRVDDRWSVARFAPGPEHLRLAAQEGFRAIVNLRTTAEAQAEDPGEEARWAERQSLAYLHHPVSMDSLTDENADAFRRAARELPGPVLVHCASGKRAGAMVTIQRACEHGMSGDEAVRMAEEIGLDLAGSPLEAFVRDYVDRSR